MQPNAPTPLPADPVRAGTLAGPLAAPLPTTRLTQARSRLAMVGRSLLGIVLTFVGLLSVTFVIGRVVPIDPVLAIVGDQAPPDVYARARAELGLDEPLVVQFATYTLQVLRGDLGTSVLTSRPVAEDIAQFFPATLELATLAIFAGIAAGVPAGIVAAVRAGRPIDHALRLVSLVGYSAPIFWLGLMGLVVFYAKLGWVAGPGRLDILYEGIVPPVTGALLVDAALAREWAAWRDAFAHIVLPAGILGIFSMAYLARMTRSFVLGELAQDYVTTARLKGASGARVILRHVLPNVAVPLATVVALAYGNLLEGAVLTETVFSWPGLGRYITSSLFNADLNAVLGGTLVVGAVFVTLSLGSDLLYRLLDPRARA